LFSLEPKYNLKDNMNVGLRIGEAGMGRDINTDGGGTTSAKISANWSYVGTYDYYFNKSGGSFVSYVGGGAGYYSIANVEFDDVNTSSNTAIDANGKMGGLLMGGFECGKFRMGIEYNLVPESELQDMLGSKVGIISKIEYINHAVCVVFLCAKKSLLCSYELGVVYKKLSVVFKN
jgi:hypothetical protein